MYSTNNLLLKEIQERYEMVVKLRSKGDYKQSKPLERKIFFLLGRFFSGEEHIEAELQALTQAPTQQIEKRSGKFHSSNWEIYLRQGKELHPNNEEAALEYAKQIEELELLGTIQK
jgi:hypothetical protein